MPRTKKVSVESNIEEKIEYLGLDFERVPKSLIATDDLNFTVLKGYDEKQYKQYKFIKVKDIDILLTPTHRMDALKEKYEKASPLYMYLDSKHEENITKYATFLKLLKKIEISEVENIEKEQKKLAEQTPFKVKYNGNYLWQIYYSEYLDRYFMLVPTEDSDYSTFFYLLKKKIEKKKDEMIFVPISYIDYSGQILSKNDLKELENYLWLFTNDYPAIYEVSDKKEKTTLQVIGETEVYGKIKTLYKNVFETKREANKFFKVLKALFILQTKLPRYYKFETRINDNGELALFFNNEEVRYENLIEFVSGEYKRAINLMQDNIQEIEELEKKLKDFKKDSIKLEKEYLDKEKEISTYLECRKTFFGKVKYYFSSSKKAKRAKKKSDNKEKEKSEQQPENIYDGKMKIEERNYTLDELIEVFKDLEVCENKKKNVVQDINAIKLKNKNLRKKIENAILYINEINKHKKSIFEFWKYSNKDEVAALEEGEEEEVNVSKIEKTFNYDNDFEKFAEEIDRNQRLKFTDSELESSYLTSTNLIEIINEIFTKQNIDLQKFSEVLTKLKAEKAGILEDDNEEFDIFGNMNKENLSNGEMLRDKFYILGINRASKETELKSLLSEATRDIKKALKKNSLEDEVYVYKASFEPLNVMALETFSLNEEAEIKKCFSQNTRKTKIYLYRLKLSRGTNFIAFSNIVMYNSRNMNLPIGMDESNRILINTDSLDIKETAEKSINIKHLADEKNDFSREIINNLEIHELESRVK